MNLNQLGSSDIWLTRVGFGAWAIGGADWAFSWGPQDDNDSIAAIHRALDLGINWVDTAAVYGLGHSEGRIVQSEAIFEDAPDLRAGQSENHLVNLNAASLERHQI